MCVSDIINKNMSVVIGLLALFVQLFTLVLAWRIYKNFGVKKQYLNLQLNIVNELATSITKTKIYTTFYLKGKPPKKSPLLDLPRSITSFTFNVFSIVYRFDSEKYEKIYIRGIEIEQTLPFLVYRNNPMLPAKIAERLSELFLDLGCQLVPQEHEYPPDYVELSATGISKEEYSMPELVYEYKESKEFVKQVKELRTEIINWLKDYGAEDINF